MAPCGAIDKFMSVRFLIFILSCLLAATSYSASRYYRYVDDSGVRVIRDTIPPEMVPKGYDILGVDGRLIKSVPRALTQEEIDALGDDKKAQAQAAAEAAKQAEADRKLLTIFSAPRDAERARDRKIEALDVLISVNRGNIVRLRSEYEQGQQLAATKERTGQVVPKHLIDKMERTLRQIEQLEESIAEKEAEKVVVREEYAKDIERLKQLMGQ